MKFLRVTNGERPTEYVSTMAEVGERIKAVESVFRHNVIVEEVEMPTDKASLICLLNDDGDGDHLALIFTTLRTWRGTSRGGLKEELPEARGEAEVS